VLKNEKWISTHKSKVDRSLTSISKKKDNGFIKLENDLNTNAEPTANNYKELKKMNEELKERVKSLETVKNSLMRLVNSTEGSYYEDNRFTAMSIQNMQTEMERLIRENTNLRAGLKYIKALKNERIAENTMMRDMIGMPKRNIERQYSTINLEKHSSPIIDNSKEISACSKAIGNIHNNILSINKGKETNGQRTLIHIIPNNGKHK